MIDSLLAFKEQANGSDILDRLSLRSRNGENGSANGTNRYTLLTLHRPSNVDQPATFLNILKGLEDLSSSCPVIFPAHPRTQKRIGEFGLNQFFSAKDGIQGKEQSSSGGTNGSIRMIDPLGYLDFLCLMANATIVVTDSGGIQEETTCLGVPCVTVRENTERPITVKVGTNVLAGTSQEGIRQATRQQLESKVTGAVPEGWDGKSAQRILEVICRAIQEKAAQVAPNGG
jgi:UDP-N-acetylglucosamine 2-epimerase (non-hydrolysing)